MSTARLLAALLLASLACVAACSAAPRPDCEPLEEPIRVLLLGDSISIGYTPVVRELIGERGFVMRACGVDGERNENCEGTNHGLRHIDRWLAQAGGRWDVIHFNFGLHDLKRVHPETGENSDFPNDPHQADPARYEIQLRGIVARLQKTGARLVFATTTPVPTGVRPYRTNADVVEYNGIARRLMNEENIAINDLYAFAEPRLAEFQRSRDVHFTKAGSAALGREVCAAVLRVAALPADSTPLESEE